MAHADLFGPGAFTCDDGYPDIAPVGAFKLNAFGLYDVLGNVWELVEGCDNKTYDGAPADGRVWSTGDCSRRVYRGGGWDSRPQFVRFAKRIMDVPSWRGLDLGFRVARTRP